MIEPPDAYWDDLGIAWRAMHSGIEAIQPRLETRLRRQSFLIASGLTMGVLLSLAGTFLGAYTLWRGWTVGPWNFVVRGIALVAISGILAVAAMGLLPALRGDQARALPDMISLSVARAERLLVAIRLGLLACIVAAVLGLVGTVIRNYSGHPPALSPIVDLAVLTIFALALIFWDRHVRVDLAKFRYLKHSIALESA